MVHFYIKLYIFYKIIFFKDINWAKVFLISSIILFFLAVCQNFYKAQYLDVKIIILFFFEETNEKIVIVVHLFCFIYKKDLKQINLRYCLVIIILSMLVDVIWLSIFVSVRKIVKLI